ncbi:glycosyltransferase [Oryzihumus leptocrescens]|uniref:GT2 family glycosyltransferase n=1 Tax=Oryzihumus leptocrescens TaxID=297536 RepID=A0A542ZG81_9MICO|nr:glycosyltransferase [Oryzihumus leptocrescens]TQL59347.1 GT2 family glycosyltransferase [Oryzihumus leptocrescens]
MSVPIGGLVTDFVVPEATGLGLPRDVEVVRPGLVRLPAGHPVAFSGWFAALPSAYWAEHTRVRSVRLEFDASAPVHVELRTSSGVAASTEAQQGSLTLELPAAPAEGWAWPAFRAPQGADVSWRWLTDDVQVAPRSLGVAITTFDRNEACLAQLDVLASAAAPGGPLADVLGPVVVVDQGTRPLREAPGFDSVAERLGQRLRLATQSNLGGSGGFARGLHDALEDPEVSHVVLLDDDALAQPEGLARAAAFAAAATRPTIVGGHMFDSAAPTTLYRLGEVLDRRRFTWTSLPGTPMNTDLAGVPVGRHAWLQPPYAVDFQPWWMCVVPREAVEAVGLPMPFFLKWDDVEFGLRSGRAGYPSVVLPGAAVWHDSWVGKGAETGWQSYFLLRNRLVTALLGDGRATPLGSETLAVSLRHLARREPEAAAMRWAALRDVLQGPAWLHRDLASARERAGETGRREHVAPHPASTLAGTCTAVGRLLRRWGTLRRDYRAAAGGATTPARWEETFRAAARPSGGSRRPVWSIVVTSFHSLDMLERHWSGVAAALADGGSFSADEVEVIIVDNADEPEIETFAHDHGFRYLPMGQNVGLSAANNEGARISRGDYLLFANPDLGVQVADLTSLAKVIDETGGVVAPRVDFVDGRPQSAARGEPYLLAKLAHRGLAPRAALERYLWPVGPFESGRVVWCAGGCTALSRDTFERIGGWPEEYFLYMEDVELGVRAGSLGIPVSVTADVRWVHEWRGDSRQRFNRGQLLHLRSAVRFYLRHPRYLGWPR